MLLLLPVSYLPLLGEESSDGKAAAGGHNGVEHDGETSDDELAASGDAGEDDGKLRHKYKHGIRHRLVLHAAAAAAAVAAATLAAHYWAHY